jgi:hypothetical protein
MSVTLTGAVQTCAVNTGYANKLWSDRYENPSNTLCPLWNGLDQYGRVVSYDSYYTKAPGCESALDRVAVENYQRPQYFDFIALDAQGYLNPAALGAPISTRENYQKTTELMRAQAVQQDYTKGASVGIQYAKTNSPWTAGVNGVNGCPNGSCKSGMQGYTRNVQEGYYDTRANRNFQDRRDLSAIAGWKSNCNACSAGNRDN